MWSLLVWDLGEGKEGERYALNMLFLLMEMDCFFFLGQPWLRKLLSSWREQPDRRKINHVFFGTGKRGVNSYERIKEDERRNDVIVGAIEERLQKGVGTNEAMKQVAKGLGQLGIKERLSWKGIKSLYYERKRNPVPQAYSALAQFLPEVVFEIPPFKHSLLVINLLAFYAK